MAKPGKPTRQPKHGGVVLGYEELKKLTQGFEVCKNDTISRLGIPLDAHLDYLVRDFARVSGLSYYGPGKPFEHSANASHFHIDNRGRAQERDRYGVSFYPNLKIDDPSKQEQTPQNDKDGDKKRAAFAKPRPTIVAKDHGAGRVITHSLDILHIPREHRDELLSHSMFKVKDDITGETRNLVSTDLKLMQGVNKDGQPWQALYLDQNLEYDAKSIENIKRNYSIESVPDRIKAYNDRFVNNLDFSKVRSRENQRDFAIGLENALQQQAIYEKANPRDMERNRFSVYKSNYIQRATEDTLRFGIGNIRNTWERLYKQGSIIMAPDLSENEPLGKFFVETISKGLKETDEKKKNEKGSKALRDLLEQSGTYLVFQKYNEEGENLKVVQRIGGIKTVVDAAIVQEVVDRDKKFLSGGGGLDGHYVEVVGGVGPDDKPPKNIFVLEGIKTAVDFASALDIDKDDGLNKNAVLSVGSAQNMVKVSEDMAKQYPDTQIVVIADNDYGNTIANKNDKQNNNPNKSFKDPQKENTGVYFAMLSVNAVKQARQELGVHPNVAFVVPPAANNANTDIADLREFYLKQANENIQAQLDFQNELNNHKGVKVTPEMQQRATAYAGRMFVEGFGQQVANSVNQGLQMALERGDVYAPPTYTPAPLEAANEDSVKPLPDTYAKAKSEASIENAARKIHIQAESKKMFEETPEHLKKINQHSLAHRGLRQVFTEDGQVKDIALWNHNYKMASVVHLLKETMQKDHPLHNIVHEASLGAYIKSDETAYIDMKKSVYATMLFGRNTLADKITPESGENTVRDFKAVVGRHAVRAMAPDQLTARDTIPILATYDQEEDRKHNFSTTLVTLAQMTAADISNHTVTGKRGELARLYVEDRVYNSMMDNIIEAVKQVDPKELEAHIPHNEKADHVVKSLEYSKEYSQILRNTNIHDEEYDAYLRKDASVKDPEVARSLRDRKDISRLYTEAIQEAVTANWEKLDAEIGENPNVSYESDIEERWDVMHSIVEQLRTEMPELSERSTIDILTRGHMSEGSALSGMAKSVNKLMPLPQEEATFTKYTDFLEKTVSESPLFTRDVKELTKQKNRENELENTATNTVETPENTTPAAEEKVVDKKPVKAVEVEESSLSLG